MINYFRNIFVVDYDQDPTFIRLVRTVLALSTLATLAIAIVTGLTSQNILSVIAGLVITAFSAVSLFLSYRNILWPGKLIFPLTILAAVTFLAINANGLHDSSIVGFTMVIIFAGLIAGQRAIPLATFFTLIGIWTVAYADMAGINTSPIAQKTGWDDIAVISIIQIVAAASLNGLMSRLNSALVDIRRNEKELQDNNYELNDIRASLEKQISERTYAAEKARTEAETARQEAEAQVWLSRGQAQLAEKMRGEHSLETLANAVTSFLCQYLGAHTGALFLVSDNTLKLTGRYAYADVEGKKEFRLDENLAGEAARMNQIIVMDDLREDALLISSALGETKPRQILIAPIATAERVVGVVEIAALDHFAADAKHEMFLRQVSESIAIAFSTAQTRLQVNELLARSQQQAEELQVQEEELRAANEELRAQAETSNTIIGQRKQEIM